MQYLSRTGLSKFIISLQEIHWGTLQLGEFAHSVAPRTTVVSCFCGDTLAARARSGIAGFPPPLARLPGDPALVRRDPLIPGRALRVVLVAARRRMR
eukprot:5409877-Pyramimonas_sp.AAC.1